MLFKVLLVVTVTLSSCYSLFTPQNYPKVNLKFIYGSDTQNQTQYFPRDMTQLLSHRQFNPKLKTLLFISGWIQNPQAPSSQLLINAYLRRRDHNILVLDWSDYSVGLYSSVMIRISNISRMFGRTLQKLFDKGLDVKSFHCVGHSFGAHSCGIIGRELYQVSNRKFKLGRITGLDPAGPGFFPVIYENPLNPQDADFVDAIHSDTFMIGTKFPTGHADFYPNYNSVQPTCPSFKLDTFYDFISDMCSHFNAMLYWIDVLDSRHAKLFPSFSCDSWPAFEEGKCKNNAVSYMGIGANHKAHGKFFIKLKSKKTYDPKPLYFFILSRIEGRLINLMNLDL